MARAASTLAALALGLALLAGGAAAAQQKLVIRGAAGGVADPVLAATATAPLYPYPYNPSDLYAPGFILVPVPVLAGAPVGAPGGAPPADGGPTGAPAVADPAAPAGAAGARRRLMGAAAAAAAAAEGSAAAASAINPIYSRRGAWMPNPFARPYPYSPYYPYNPYPYNPYPYNPYIIGSSAGAAKPGRKMLGF